MLKRKVTKQVLGTVDLHNFNDLTLVEVVGLVAKSIDAYGRESKVSVHWYYDELDITIYKEIVESDEDYNKRVEKYKARKKATKHVTAAKRLAAKKKQEDADRKLFVKLRQKYNW